MNIYLPSYPTPQNTSQNRAHISHRSNSSFFRRNKLEKAAPDITGKLRAPVKRTWPASIRKRTPPKRKKNGVVVAKGGSADFPQMK